MSSARSLALVLLALTACGGPRDELVIYVASVGVRPYDAWAPVADAQVVLDLADGTRIESFSDASGRAVLAPVSFAAGAAEATAYADGHAMTSFEGITPEVMAGLPPLPSFPSAGGALVIDLIPKTPAQPSTVMLHGAILHKLTASNFVTLSSHNSTAIFESTDDHYALTVEPDKPTTLVLLEWTSAAPAVGYQESKLRWLSFDLPAQTGDASFDLDLAAGTPLLPTSVTMTLQTAGNLGGVPSWGMFAADRPSFFLGSRTLVSTARDPRVFVAAGEYVAPPEAATPVLTQALFSGVNGSTAFNQAAGPPVDGSTLVALSSSSTPLTTALGEDVRLHNVDPGAERVGIEIVDHLGPNDDELYWILQTVRGSEPTHVRLPQLPSRALGNFPITPKGRVSSFGGEFDATHPGVPQRGAYSQFFVVTP